MTTISTASAASPRRNGSSLRSVGGEVAQDEVGRVHPPGRPPDADPHAQVVLGAEGRGDRAQAVVAALSPTPLEADVARGDVELVVDDDEVLRVDREERHQRLDRSAGLVHVAGGDRRRRPGARARRRAAVPIRTVAAGARALCDVSAAPSRASASSWATMAPTLWRLPA